MFYKTLPHQSSGLKFGEDVIACGTGMGFAGLKLQAHALGNLIKAGHTMIIVAKVYGADLTIDRFAFWHDEAALTPRNAIVLGVKTQQLITQQQVWDDL